MFLLREMSYLKSLDFQMFHIGPQTVVVFLELGRNLLREFFFHQSHSEVSPSPGVSLM